MDKNKTKLNELLVKTADEYRTDLEKLDHRFKNIKTNFLELSILVIQKIRKSCTKSFEWMEQNSYRETDGSINIKKGIPQNILDEKITELEKCSEEHDRGIRTYIEQVYSEEDQIKSKSEKCFNSCFEKAENYNDDDLKRCYANCVTNSLKEMNNLCQNMENKIDEFYKGFNH